MDESCKNQNRSGSRTDHASSREAMKNKKTTTRKSSRAIATKSERKNDEPGVSLSYQYSTTYREMKNLSKCVAGCLQNITSMNSVSWKVVMDYITEIKNKGTEFQDFEEYKDWRQN